MSYDVNTPIINYFKSRKSDHTRELSLDILKYLCNEVGEWVQQKIILNSINGDSTAISRILNDLSLCEVIQRKNEYGGSGRPRVFYRSITEFNPVHCMTREELEYEVTYLRKELSDYFEGNK